MCAQVEHPVDSHDQGRGSRVVQSQVRYECVIHDGDSTRYDENN